MTQGLAEGFARRRLPEPRRPVITGGDHKSSIRAECGATNGPLMTQGLADGFARRRLPEPRRPVLTGGDHKSSIPAECGAQNPSS